MSAYIPRNKKEGGGRRIRGSGASLATEQASLGYMRLSQKINNSKSVECHYLLYPFKYNKVQWDHINTILTIVFFFEDSHSPCWP